MIGDISWWSTGRITFIWCALTVLECITITGDHMNNQVCECVEVTMAGDVSGGWLEGSDKNIYKYI